MKILTKIQYRDDKTKTYSCVDNPAIGQWVTLYLENLKRLHVPSEAIKSIEVTIKNERPFWTSSI